MNFRVNLKLNFVAGLEAWYAAKHGFAHDCSPLVAVAHRSLSDGLSGDQGPTSIRELGEIN